MLFISLLAFYMYPYINIITRIIQYLLFVICIIIYIFVFGNLQFQFRTLNKCAMLNAKPDHIPSFSSDRCLFRHF